MAKERRCLCCLRSYMYCAHNCQDYDPNKTWMYLVHDERCLDVYNTWQQYRGEQITKQEAARILKALRVEDDILKTNSPVVPVLKEILDIKDEVVEEEVKEELPEEKETVESKKTEEPVETKAPKTEQPKEQKEFKKNYNQKYNKK